MLKPDDRRAFDVLRSGTGGPPVGRPTVTARTAAILMRRYAPESGPGSALLVTSNGLDAPKPPCVRVWTEPASVRLSRK